MISPENRASKSLVFATTRVDRRLMDVLTKLPENQLGSLIRFGVSAAMEASIAPAGDFAGAGSAAAGEIDSLTQIVGEVMTSEFSSEAQRYTLLLNSFLQRTGIGISSKALESIEHVTEKRVLAYQEARSRFVNLAVGDVKAWGQRR